jgi:hypothetical protein
MPSSQLAHFTVFSRFEIKKELKELYDPERRFGICAPLYD